MIPTILESEVRALFAINGSSVTGVIPDLVEKGCYLFGINSITDLKLYIIPDSARQFRPKNIHSVLQQKCVGQDYIMATYKVSNNSLEALSL